MTITLYDLAGADPDRRFSPYCWRTKLALAHKGLAYETVPWLFTDKAAIGFSGQERVPVMIDGDKTIVDSWAIARYLEDHYPDRPSLFGGAIALAHFINSWADTALNPILASLIVSDIPACLDPRDTSYFTTSREARFGRPLHQVTADRDQRRPALQAVLAPLRTILADQPFLGGSAPVYADYIVMGTLMWARCVSPFRLLDPGDAVHGWRERLLDRFDGLCRKAVGFDV